jgi:hypothetical protein
LVEKETTSESLDGLEMVSFLESGNTLNLARPNVLPASLEYVIIGAGAYLKNFSAPRLNLSNQDRLSFGVVAVESVDCA